jgi:hypothetical protein
MLSFLCYYKGFYHETVSRPTAQRFCHFSRASKIDYSITQNVKPELFYTNIKGMAEIEFKITTFS